MARSNNGDSDGLLQLAHLREDYKQLYTRSFVIPAQAGIYCFCFNSALQHVLLHLRLFG